jgi:hypothetical protein
MAILPDRGRQGIKEGLETYFKIKVKLKRKESKTFTT